MESQTYTIYNLSFFNNNNMDVDILMMFPFKIGILGCTYLVSFISV